MQSSSKPRSPRAAACAGLALAIVQLSALTACGGAASDEQDLDLAGEGTPSPTELGRAFLDGDDASQLAPIEPEANALGQLQQPIFGSNACQDVQIAVRNFKSDPITVRSIDYYNDTEERWQTEDLDNRTLEPDGGLDIWIENLENTRGDLVTLANLYFDHLDHSHHTDFNIDNQTCQDGDIMFDLFVY